VGETGSGEGGLDKGGGRDISTSGCHWGRGLQTSCPESDRTEVMNSNWGKRDEVRTFFTEHCRTNLHGGTVLFSLIKINSFLDGNFKVCTVPCSPVFTVSIASYCSEKPGAAREKFQKSLASQ
jgi:hypothetical protein